MSPDNEINALSNVYEALKGLNNAQIQRILDWITGKFDLDKQHGLKSVETESASPSEPGPLPEPSPTASALPFGEPLKKRRGRRPGKAKTTEAPQKKRRGRPPAKVKPVEEKPGPQPDVAPVITGLLKYDNFEELLLFSTAKTNTAKILLAAYYLQENKNYKEFSSYDIHCLFKDIGEEIGQPSPALSYLMSKKPAILIQTGSQDPGLKARRNFRVTEEGLRIARNYIKG